MGHSFSSIGPCFPILNGRKSLFNLSTLCRAHVCTPDQIYILWCQIWQRAASLLVFNFFLCIYIFKKQPFANFDVRAFLLNITHYWQQSDGPLSMQCNGKEHDMHLLIIWNHSHFLISKVSLFSMQWQWKRKQSDSFIFFHFRYHSYLHCLELTFTLIMKTCTYCLLFGLDWKYYRVLVHFSSLFIILNSHILSIVSKS